MEGKFFMIRSGLSGNVLDIADSNMMPGTEVTTRGSHGGDNQLWYEDRINSVIRSKIDDSFVLQVDGDHLSIGNFEPEEFWQKWKCAGDKLEHAEDSSKVLDIAGHCEDDGARVCSWEPTGASNQQWDFENVNPRTCIIRSKMHGKVMDVNKADPSAGAKVVMWKYKDTEDENQLWWEDKYGNIRSKLNDFVFDSGEGSIRLQPYDGTIATRLWFKNGIKISNKEDPSIVIDIKKADTSKGARLCAFDYKASDNQHWKFEYIN